MKNILAFRWSIAAVAVAVCFLLFFGVSGVANAAEEGVEASSILFANPVLQLVSNRARMIQFSVVAVVFGCALLWWRR